MRAVKATAGAWVHRSGNFFYRSGQKWPAVASDGKIRSVRPEPRTGGFIQSTTHERNPPCCTPSCGMPS